MTSEQRARIIRETRENLRRFEAEHSGLPVDGASYADAEAGAVDSQPSADRVPPPEPEDPIAKWARESRAYERAREEGRAELRRAELQHERQNEAFWNEIDRRIDQALANQRAAILEAVAEGFSAAVDMGDTVHRIGAEARSCA